MELQPQDIKQLDQRGIKPDILEEQLQLLKRGTIPVHLSAPATISNGIIKLDPQEADSLLETFNQQLDNLTITRFVPASGAASRMFKAFYQYLETGQETPEIKNFAGNFHKFAFYQQIKCHNAPDYSCAINNMINVLKLAQLPKALIPFHWYPEGPRTAFAEHLVESALVLGAGKTVNVHFTISAEHQRKFTDLVSSCQDRYEQRYNCSFNLSFSCQSPATDTIAIDRNNNVVRTNNGALLFRPGGHGALLRNLSRLPEDIIFIKNIDNVQPDHLKVDSIRYKRVLGGYLIDFRQKVYGLLKALEENQTDTDAIARKIVHDLQLRLPENFSTLAQTDQKNTLFTLLNRPIRICGMVKNTGEPGGGPFWVINRHNQESLQIVESSQVNFDDPRQADIFRQATHFNPVDIACSIKDYRGQRFNLHQFTDPETAFITEKSYNGKTIKVLEHPGLWNGAMAHWLTVFIEVPASTFSPVKTLTDLLKKSHQPPPAFQN